MLHQCTQCDYNSKVKCNVKRHMKVHVKRNEAHPTTKRKHDEDNTHEEDQPMIKKKWYVLDDDELEKRIYTILYDVKVSLKSVKSQCNLLVRLSWFSRLPLLNGSLLLIELCACVRLCVFKTLFQKVLSPIVPKREV